MRHYIREGCFKHRDASKNPGVAGHDTINQAINLLQMAIDLYDTKTISKPYAALAVLQVFSANAFKCMVFNCVDQMGADHCCVFSAKQLKRSPNRLEVVFFFKLCIHENDTDLN